MSRLRARHCRQEQTEGTLSQIHRLDGTTGPGVLRTVITTPPAHSTRDICRPPPEYRRKADEPTTATASGARGLRTSPTRQSRMYSLENRHSTVDWTFVALVTKDVDRRSGKPSEACPTLCQDQTRPLVWDYGCKPRTTCLYSAASMDPRSLSAACHRVSASTPNSVALAKPE